MTGLKRHLWGMMFALLLANSLFASAWTASTSDLAKAIASAAGPGSIGLSFTNASSLSKSDAAEIQKELEAELRSYGIRVSLGSNGNGEVHVTFSENLQGYLWVAEIKHGNQSQVQMVTVPRAESSVTAKSGPSVVVRKTLIWSQPEQILDALVAGDRMVLLGADSVSLITLKDGKWQREQAIEIPRSHVFPRDLRGLLEPAKDHMADIYLPGTICNLSTSGGTAISCRDGDDPWPLGTKSALFNSSRNYFTGAIVPTPAKSGGPFYSLAAIPRSTYQLLLTTGVDGRVHVSDGTNDRTLAGSLTADWGSDIAALKSSCGGGTQVLVTAAGDDTVTDSLRAYEIPDRDPVQASAAADFPGPITALWTHADSSTVTAVSRNLRTGSYEAYNVSVTCTQ